MPRFVFFTLCLIFSCLGCSRDCTPETSIKKGKAFSLKVALYTLRSLGVDEPLPNVIRYMGGISRLSGFLFDEANQDIILFGKADTSLPGMLLEDFVVALKNIDNDYAKTKNRTIIYTPPGCSIDPEPSIMARLDSLHASQSDVNLVYDAWTRICGYPQKVRVLGLPFDSHFSKILVDADYDMKRVVDGSDSLPIKGFYSLVDQNLLFAREQFEKGKRLRSAKSMSRFWFNAGETTFSQNKNTIVFCECNVRLSTEEEFLTGSNKITGSGKANKMAAKFSEDFSNFYSEISKIRPIYYELENLFRMCAIVRAMREFRSPPGYVNTLLNGLKKNCTVPVVKVPRQLPGRANKKGFELRRDSDNEYQTLRLSIPSCGGVDMDMKITSDNLIKDRKDKLIALTNSILKSRARTSNSLSWSYETSNR